MQCQSGTRGRGEEEAANGVNLGSHASLLMDVRAEYRPSTGIRELGRKFEVLVSSAAFIGSLNWCKAAQGFIWHQPERKELEWRYDFP